AGAPVVARVGAEIDIDLQGGEAPRQDALDHALDLVEGHARLDLTVGVDADAVAELAAQELVDRHAQGFAFQIPQGDLDPGEGGDQGSGEAAIEDVAPAQVLEDRVDLEGIAADKLAPQLVD